MKVENYFFVSKMGRYALKNEMAIEECAFGKFLFDDDEKVREFVRHNAATWVESGERSGNDGDCIYLIGRIYGRGDTHEGEWIFTSRIMFIADDWSHALTKSGSRYDLGEPLFSNHEPEAQEILSTACRIHGEHLRAQAE